MLGMLYLLAGFARYAQDDLTGSESAVAWSRH